MPYDYGATLTDFSYLSTLSSLSDKLVIVVDAFGKKICHRQKELDA